MDLGIKDKVAVILAASKGIGRGCADVLAQEGVNLAICARSEAELSGAARELSMKTSVFAQTCDVTNESDSQRFLESVREKFGRVDILVNNCGGPKAGGYEFDWGEKDWQDAFERCLMQVVRWSRAVTPEMKSRGWGRVVHIVSTSVKQPIDGLILSNTMRPGVIGFTKTAARELGPFNVLMNSVLPGSIYSARADELVRTQVKETRLTADEILKKKSKDIPLGRLGSCREVGDLVAFLCSERASYITGASIPIDGGLIRGV